jgi:DNA-binding transcriptional LysR family regulator
MAQEFLTTGQMKPVHPFNSQPMNSRQLLAFVVVARTRSFTLAGKELFLSQSAVSHALTTLEEELNCRLIHRDGKKLQITPAGEHLLHYGEKILADMAAARGSLQQRARWGASQLRIAADAILGPHLLPEVLVSFRREFPDWIVNVTVGESRECVEWLEQESIDMAVTIAPSRAEAVEIVPLFTDEIMWIVSPDHPWAQNGNFSVEEIPSQTFVCDGAGTYTYRLLEKYFEPTGFRINWDLELGNLEAVKAMVKATGAVTALAPWSVRKELEENSLVSVSLGKRKLKRNWCFLQSPNRKMRLADELFTKLCLQAANMMMESPKLAVAVSSVLYFIGLNSGWLNFGCSDIGWMDLDMLDVVV